jgi:hypothetical protein
MGAGALFVVTRLGQTNVNEASCGLKHAQVKFASTVIGDNDSLGSVRKCFLSILNVDASACLPSKVREFLTAHLDARNSLNDNRKLCPFLEPGYVVPYNARTPFG